MMIFNSVFIFLVGKEGFPTILVYIKRPFPIIYSTIIVVRFVSRVAGKMYNYYSRIDP